MAYVYRHIRLDTKMPFYIGVGSDKYHRRAYSDYMRTHFWKSIVNKHGYEVDIIMDDITQEQAKIKEEEFIKMYGRFDLGLGTLVNFTNGGEGRSDIGNSGKKIITKETRDKMAAKLRGRPLPQWQRNLLSRAAMGKKVYWCYKKIIQYTIKGVFVKEFESMESAGKELKLERKNIGKVCKGQRNHVGGFIFRYVGDSFDKYETNFKVGTKPVINTETNIIYNSTKEASVKENINKAKLKNMLSGAQINKSKFIYYIK